MGRFRYSWQRWRRWRAYMGLFMLPAYKGRPGSWQRVRAAMGLKMDPGKNSRVRFTL
jgi:hypothetical protein